MAAWYSDYYGDEWEEMCNKLLPYKHGPTYQPVTDKGGDWGLDGFVVGQGIAYQAYGQEPENTDPKKGFTNKVSGDLNKLKTYQADIQEFLGDEKINQWVLLFNKQQIPHSDLHKYQTKKKSDVIKFGLPFIADNFSVIFQTPAYLETEYIENKKRIDSSIDVPIPLGTFEVIDELKSNDKYKAIYDKFSVIIDDDETAHKLAYDEAKCYFEYAIQLDEIHRKEPELYAAIEEVRSAVVNDAEKGSLLQGDFTSWANTKNVLEYRIDNCIAGNLSSGTKQRAREFIISDWFVSCPLRFKNNKS